MTAKQKQELLAEVRHPHKHKITYRKRKEEEKLAEEYLKEEIYNVTSKQSRGSVVRIPEDDVRSV